MELITVKVKLFLLILLIGHSILDKDINFDEIKEEEDA